MTLMSDSAQNVLQVAASRLCLGQLDERAVAVRRAGNRAMRSGRVREEGGLP